MKMYGREVVTLDLSIDAHGDPPSALKLPNGVGVTPVWTMKQPQSPDILSETNPLNFYENIDDPDWEKKIYIDGHVLGKEYGRKLVDCGVCSEDSIRKVDETGDQRGTYFVGDRGDLFKSLPRGGIGAEIGVDQGLSAKTNIYPILRPKELYLIDPWDMCEDNAASWAKSKENRENVTKTFSHDDSVTVLQDFSLNAAETFEDGYFDWIHLDWALRYNDAKKDLACWLPKVKKGGYITGDQWCLESHHWAGTFGATLEFMLKYIIKRPNYLKEAEERRDIFMNSIVKKHAAATDFTEPYDAYIKKYPFADTLVRYRDDGVDTIYQLKPSTRVLEAIANCKWITYFPSPRRRGGAYRIEVGDWIDDLNVEQIKEEANQEELNDGWVIW